MADVALTLVAKGLTPASKTAASNANGNVPEATDAGNVDTFPNSGVEVLVVDNTGASGRTITPKDKNGTALGAITVPANELAVIGPFDVSIFGETVKFQSSHAELVVVPVKLTGGSPNILTAR